MEFLILSCLAAVAIIIRIFLHYIDIDGILSAARKKGWRNVKVEWAPFAAGAFFEDGERCYRVFYLDEQGIKNIAHCKTSIMTGLFWRE
ncbi:hypothetical protein H8K35_07670 [Undibacterium sp. LX40W]|uniref:Uncharacterized protein n=1 Tax=Undibacterium nitidum TaxID=2762298 RepID=A0A923HLP6_9BURK|nr:MULTISPECIES: hypothetical protein [Undibacterium]MBC3881689.1 hypothetical protein [Undibacterium nitidum]MBC3891528.1 hypothetical protein [Undibacterium sp. LX40W]